MGHETTMIGPSKSKLWTTCVALGMQEYDEVIVGRGKGELSRVRTATTEGGNSIGTSGIWPLPLIIIKYGATI